MRIFYLIFTTFVHVLDLKQIYSKSTDVFKIFFEAFLGIKWQVSLE